MSEKSETGHLTSGADKIRIGYFADGPWSYNAFDRFMGDPSVSIAFVCARHGAPDVVLQERARAEQIDFLTHPNVNSDDFLTRLDRYGCDLFVSISFDQIFGERLIYRPRLHSINCHAGKLPFYRGRQILNWALINDETEFGITVHYMDEGIDTGDIIAQRTFPITDADDFATLLVRAHTGCGELLYDVVKQLQHGTATRTRQDTIHPTGFYCIRRLPSEHRLDWNQPSRDVFGFVRALCRPGPEARTMHNGTEVRVNRVDWIPAAPTFKGVTGAVIGVEANAFLVKTSDSFVRVREWTGIDKVRIGDRFS